MQGGGMGNDYPLALITNQQNELIIAGNTASPDFPTTAGAYDRSMDGMMDYFIAKLSVTGNALVASTFIGGNSIEGGSLSDTPAGLALDNNANIYLSGSTGSSNFPVINGFQTALKSNRDGVVAKFNSNLTSLLWSSYIGTNTDDVVSDIKIGASGKIYLAGYNTTNFGSPNGLQTTANAIHPSPVGNSDGFVAVISQGGNQVLACSYIGTNQEDNLRFLELDASENIYVTGFTNGSYPVTANTYSFPATNRIGGYYIHKLNNTLSSTLLSTHLGTGNSFQLQSPTAFNVDDCENIYLSGYSSSPNYPVTSNAFSSTFKSIYMCQLSSQAGSLIYGSFIGDGNGFGNHVHYANRSTITEDGHLYHIECTTSSTYPVTQGAFSAKVSMSNDGAMFKFKFDTPAGAAVKARIQNPILPGCAPYTVAFSNISNGGKSYRWNFGDGSAEDTQNNPTHTFQTPGMYNVRLIAGGQKSCNDPTQTFDTTFVQVEVKANPVVPRQQDLLCGGFAELDAGNPGATYRWFNGATSQTILVNKPGTYQVEIDNGICKSTEIIEVKQGISLIIPNIFTPNNDNTNQYFVIPNGGPNTSFRLFNRWGVQIYSNNNYQNNWSGDGLAEGVYYYLIDSPINCGKAKKGWVEIVR
jgi:gliding motility-associated-like protein